MIHPEFTPQAEAVRAKRRALRKQQAPDPLAKRAKLIARWKSDPWHARLFGTKHVWWHPFKLQKAYWPLLMPKLRAHLEAREKAKKAEYAAYMAQEQRKWIQKKAERAAAKARSNSPQADMLDRLEKRA